MLQSSASQDFANAVSLTWAELSLHWITTISCLLHTHAALWYGAQAENAKLKQNHRS